MNRIVVLIAVAVVLVWTATSFAHHSASATYDVLDEMEIEGEIVQVSLRNPHSAVFIEAQDANGEVFRWGVSWGAATRLRAQGGNNFKVGDQVVVTGNPGRNPQDHRLLMISMVRLSDGFSWGLEEGQEIQGAR